MKNLDGSVLLWQEQILFGKKKHSEIKRNDLFCTTKIIGTYFVIGIEFIKLYFNQNIKQSQQ